MWKYSPDTREDIFHFVGSGFFYGPYSKVFVTEINYDVYLDQVIRLCTIGETEIEFNVREDKILITIGCDVTFAADHDSSFQEAAKQMIGLLGPRMAHKTVLNEQEYEKEANITLKLLEEIINRN